jgi:hypothetical protein
MTWNVGQHVICNGVDWGVCQVRMSNDNMVVIYCPRHELVMSGSPVRLYQAGWRTAIAQDHRHDLASHHLTDLPSDPRPPEPSNVVCLERWKNGDRTSNESVSIPHR